MKNLGGIKVVIEASSAPFKKELRSAKKEAESFSKAVDSSIGKFTATAQSVNAPAKKVTDSIRAINRTIKEFATQAQIDAGVKQYTEGFMELQTDISLTEKSIKNLEKRANELSDSDKFDVSQEFKDNEKAISDTEKALDALIAKRTKMEDSGKAFEPTADYQGALDQMAQAKSRLKEMTEQQKEWEGLGITPDTSSAMGSLLKDIKEVEMEIKYLEDEMADIESSGKDKVHTEAYQSLTKEIENSKEALSGYISKREQMKADGSDQTESKKWRNIQNSIQAAKEEKQRYLEQSAAQMDSGTHVEPSTKGFSSGSYIQEAVTAAKAAPAAISSYLMSAQGPLVSFKNRVAETVKEIPVIGRVVTESAYLAKKGFSMMAFSATKVGSGILKAGGAAASLIKRFASGLPVIRRFTGEMNRGGMYGRGLSGIFRTLGMTARFMFASFVIRGALDGAKEGFNNLAQYSDRTNQSLSLLQSQLTQLKNSLATAFAPILNMVTPYLSQLIDYVIGATNALAQFFAALTGQSSYTVAKRVNVDYAKSLGGTASAADNANKSAKELKRTLMGFDEVNKLEDNSDSGSGGSSGGSGGGGGVSAGDMFTTETINSQFSDFANMVKEAWKNADFTEIGEILGDKLNNALENIPWDKIKATSKKIAKSIATLLNGFIEETDWYLVGKTFAEGINTAIEFGYTFVTTFNWKEFGTAIGEAVNGFFDNVDWAKAGKTFSKGFKGIFDTINTALEEVDWNKVGKDIGTFLINIDWVGILVGVGKAIANAIIASLNLGQGLYEAICKGLRNIDWSKVAKEVWELFKKAWELIGVFISIGVKLFKEGWKTIVDWVKDFIGGAISVAVSLIKFGWKSLKGFIGDAVSVAIKLGKSGWKTISGFIGSTVSVGVKLAKKGWKKLGDWLGGLTQTLKLKLPKIKVQWSTKKVAGFKITYPSGFKTYASGGFPEEGPFMMNRGEIAGKFSNGKGVVANNQQITDGIAKAVGPAVYAAMMSAMQASGSKGGNVVVTLAGDAKGIFKVVKKEAQNYMNANGVSPFPV